MPRNNPIGANIQAYMPGVPPYYVRDKIRAPGTVGDTQTIAAQGKQRAQGAANSEAYGLDFLRRKKVVRPFSYTSAPTTPVNVAANGRAIIQFAINKEAAFEFCKLAAVVDIPALGQYGIRGDDFTFRIIEGGKQNALSNGFIHNLIGTGSGIFPHVLPQPLWLKPAGSIQIEVVNLRAVPIDIHFEFQGKHYYLREFENITQVPDFLALSQQEKLFFLATQKKWLSPYYYTLDTESLTLAAGAAGNAQISIRQSGDFEVFAWASYSDAPFTWQARESNTGRFFSNQPLASAASLGDGERPRILPETMWIDSNSDVYIDFVNLDPLNANTIYFTLIGRQWYDTASMNLTAGPEFFYDKYRAME